MKQFLVAILALMPLVSTPTAWAGDRDDSETRDARAAHNAVETSTQLSLGLEVLPHSRIGDIEPSIGAVTARRKKALTTPPDRGQGRAPAVLPQGRLF